MQTSTGQAVLWSTSDIVLRKGIGFFISIILARLISPEEFGVIAMLMMFTAVASLFVESGFASALIQRQNHSRSDECTVFWFNVIFGAFVALLLMLIAPWIASFYGHDILVPLARLMALNVWLSSFLTVPTALLTKNLDFQTQAKAGLSAVVVSGIVAIYLALQGWGVWALAVQTLTLTIVNGLVLWAINSWRPSLEFSWASLRSLFKYGAYLMLSGLLDSISTRLYTLFIGKNFSALDLAYFYRASSTKDMPQGILATIFARITFPLFSSQVGDGIRLRESFRIALVASMAINLPVMAGLLMTADELVPILFGSRWEGAIPILKVLCGVGALWPVHLVNINVLKAMGHSHLFFRIEIIKKTLFVATLIITSQISLIAIAWGMLLLGLVSTFINTWYTKKYLAYGLLKQLMDITPYVLATIVMALATTVCQYFISSESLTILFLSEFVVGFFTYAFVTKMFQLEILELGRWLIARSKDS